MFCAGPPVRQALLATSNLNKGLALKARLQIDQSRIRSQSEIENLKSAIK
jgi:hypothetical protein